MNGTGPSVYAVEAARPEGSSMAARPGAALMIVLWLIVVLGTISSGVLLSTRSATGAAANYRAGVVGRFAAESGVTVAITTIEQNLDELSEMAERRDYLNDLAVALGENDQVALGDALFAVALIDVSARLDVNNADATGLATLFSYFTDRIEAERTAAAIREYITGAGSIGDPTFADASRYAVRLQAAKPLQSLDELLRIPGVSRDLVDRAGPFLTVDGDGTINRVTASDTVRAAAGGSLRDEPSRILVVSRGWLQGQPATHEIQAVYAIAGNGLVLVRWREREL